MTRKSVACQAIGAGSALRRGLGVVQAVSTMLTHGEKRSAQAGGRRQQAVQHRPSCAGITVMDNRWSAERGGVLYRGRRRESRARGRCQVRVWHLELMV